MDRSLLKSLLKPDAYPESVHSVTMIQTHVSWIFLTDSHAYKIKKPVDFGFLNFSTIDRRRFYCNEEVRLNRRLCPDIYEGVVEVREAPGGAAFHGSGPVIDHAVMMKRLPADGMLDRMVDERRAGGDELRRVAEAIARFHAAAPTSPAAAGFGSPERVMTNWRENFEQAVPFVGATISERACSAIHDWVDLFSHANRELFERRMAGGFVRECDGDIHLENICLDGDNIHIFDCIEFSDRFRCSDTAADIAFLLMDLDFHGRPDLASEVLEAYLSASGDREIVALIDFYKIYRAFVRGKVESLLARDPGLAQPEAKKTGVRAARYFRLARGYVERLRRPAALYITCGLMGSGKSTLAEQLGFELGIPLFSSDATRKRLAGVSSDTRADDAFGSGLYTPAATAATYAELLRLAGDSLRRGKGAIIDASFIRRADRDAAAGLAHCHGVPLVIIEAHCPHDLLMRRLAERRDSISDGRPELLERQAACFEPPSGQEGLLVQFTQDDSVDEIYERLPSC